MLAVCNACPRLESLSPDGTYVDGPSFVRRRDSNGAERAWDTAYGISPTASEAHPAGRQTRGRAARTRSCREFRP